MPRLVLLAALLGALALAAAPRARPLPPIVFVSRAPLPEGGARVPGLGPTDRARAAGGRLMVRLPDGDVRALLPEDAAFDVSDPAVAPDGRRVAFAALPAPDSCWRLWQLDLLDGSGSVLTAPAEGREDDLDPCWIGPDALVFVRAERAAANRYDGGPVSNLWRLDLDTDQPPRAITFERNGADEPAWDARAARVLFARWWFNPFRAADTPSGLARVAPHTPAADSVNLWQVMSVRADGTGERLEAGAPGARRAAMGYQPAPAANGRVLAVFARNTGLSPGGTRLGIQSLRADGGPAVRLAGSARDDDASTYDSPRGLAAPAACAPAVLPDGRIVFSQDASGRGDFDLWVMDADGAHKMPLVALAGSLELDAAVVREWKALPPAPLPPRAAGAGLFTYRNRDVFAPGGAARVNGARIRFFSAGGDSALLLREVPVSRAGQVNERGLPAETPMFEQLVDAHGRVLATPRGPAHVAGFNVAAPGAVVECVGCHVGHSMTLRPK